MAVTGLHNVSVFGPSLFVESQSSGSSLLEEPQVRPSTRASSLLQMWRELEDEHVVSPSYRQRHRRSNGSDSDCTSIVASVGQGSDNGDGTSEYADDTENHGTMTRSETNLEDSDSIISGQSSDLGDIERERVRQVFREWMNSGAKGHSPDGFPLNNNTGEQCLGENVRERVRIIKEWVQTVARHGNNNGSLRDEVAEVGSQIGQPRDGLVITHPEIGARRPVRRLCGRQTLLDLLLRAQSERNRELRDLSEQRPVSDFAHRNRIQAFLRGRFLRNEIFITDKRPSSMAATELGLLRQRSTVSDLREGFLSKLHNSTSIPGNSAEASSSLSDESNGEAESTCIRGAAAETHTASVSEIDADENRSRHEFVSRVTEVEDSSLDHDGNAEVSLGIESSRSVEQPTFDSESEHSSHFDHNDAVVNNEPSLEYVDINYSEPLEVLHEHYEPRSDASYVHEVAGDTADIEGNTNEEFDRQEALTLEEEVQDSEIGIDNNSWHQLTGVAFTEWTDASREDTTGNQWFRETSDYEQDQIQGSSEFWPNHNFQEAVDSWLDMPTGEVSGSVGRMDAFYFPDNVQSMELRELFSRRRVSSLLRSGFRESLDQVLQSHVERQGHVSGDWELDTTSSPALIEPDQGQLNGEQTLAPSDGSEINEFDPSSIHITASQPLWDEVLPGANWPHISSNQHMGTEWEVINELRIDMARLQQRMNNMQSMLEACMELQIELQRSVHQEVSAALNQSILSRVPLDAISGADSWDSNILHHESKWDFVRKGICCLCCDSNIDSLLYRCGHMCTCSKCAEGLVQGSGKCPMCEAPIVEVVRAYFIH